MSEETPNTAPTTPANKAPTQNAPTPNAGGDDVITEGTVAHNKTLLNDLVKQKGRVTQLETEAATHGEALTARDNRIAALLTDNAIRDVIGSYDVKPALRPALINHLKNMIALNDEVATFNGKSADDFGKDYFGSEEGREWLKPAINSGGGATGNAGAGEALPETWNMTAYREMKQDDPAMAAAYAKKFNKSF